MYYVAYFILFTWFTIQISLIPTLILFPAYNAAAASSFLFILPLLFKNTQSDFATPKSSSLHSYLAFMTMFQIVMFVFLKSSPKTAIIPYSTLGHSCFIGMMMILTFTLYKHVDNQDKFSKKTFVKNMEWTFPFFAVTAFTYTNLLFFSFLEKTYSPINVSSENDESQVWMSPASIFRKIKFLNQLTLILSCVGSVIATSVFLQKQWT